MVSILPAARSSWDVIGQQIGHSLDQNLPGIIQQRQQRERGQSALDRADKEIQQANGDPYKIALAFARVGADVPGLDRSLGPLMQIAMQRAQASRSPTVADITGKQNLPSFMEGSFQQQPGGQTPQAIPGQGNIAPQAQEKPSTPFVNAAPIQLGSYLPYNLQGQISPEQRANILDDVKRAGGDVDFTKQQIDEYNQGNISLTDLANANVDKQAAQVQRQLGFEDKIKQRIDKQLPKDTPESEKNIYYNLINKELAKGKYPDFTSAWQSISNKVDNFRKTYENYVNSIPEGDFMGLSKDAERTYRGSAQPLLKTDPLAYNAIEDAFVKKGNSIVTPAKILKPLPQNVEKIADSAGDYRKLLYPGFSFFHEVTEDEMSRNIDKAQSEQKDEIPKLSNQLGKAWNEDISLINLYSDLKAKGWMTDNIASLFDSLSDRFSPQQQKERTQLNEAPRIPIRYLTK
jgi:hypothetical protein